MGSLLQRARMRTVKVMAATFAVASVAALATATPAAAAYPTQYFTHYTVWAQDRDYNCGPYATKIALTTFGIDEAIKYISIREGTDNNGTDSIANVTSAMNFYMGYYGNLDRFTNVYPNDAPHHGTSTVKAYLLDNIYGDHGFVANVVNYQTDVNGILRGYGSGGHYVAVVGYRASGDQAAIADPGNGQAYWMSTSHLAAWIGHGRGISVTPLG
jgi:peptidase C39-like protein